MQGSKKFAMVVLRGTIDDCFEYATTNKQFEFLRMTLTKYEVSTITQEIY